VRTVLTDLLGTIKNSRCHVLLVGIIKLVDNKRIGMEFADCKHIEEDTLGVSQGLTYTVCTTCGQTRRYKRGDDLSIVITKLGRIGDAIVLPLPGQSLDITPEETRLVREGFDIIEEERLFKKNLGKRMEKASQAVVGNRFS